VAQDVWRQERQLRGTPDLVQFALHLPAKAAAFVVPQAIILSMFGLAGVGTVARLFRRWGAAASSLTGGASGGVDRRLVPSLCCGGTPDMSVAPVLRLLVTNLP
jgi:hypothetical protein